jgi:DNA-binding beta-propeller fold protein YncE
MIRTLLRALSLRLFVPFAFATFAIDVRAGALAFDSSGNLFAVEHWRSIAKFTGDGIQSTFAAGLQEPIGLCIDNGGNLFVSDFRSNSIYEFTPDGKRSTFATGISPKGMAFDHSNRLFVVQGDSVFKFTPTGTKSIFAAGVSNLSNPIDLALDEAGNLFVVPVRMLDKKNGITPSIIKFSPDAARTVFASSLSEPEEIATDGSGNLFVVVETHEHTLYSRHAILKFSPDGTKHTFASELSVLPRALACSRSGDLFVLTDHSILKFDSNGVQSTFASDWLSPDKRWEFQNDESWAGLVKAGTDETVVDLSKDSGAYQLDFASVVWAPDSKRFAFNCRLPASHALYETIAIYQLRDGKWVALTLPVDPDSRKSQVTQLAKGHLTKQGSRTVGANDDVLKVLKWTDADTALLYAAADKASLLFTLKFDAEGNSKIVKVQPVSEKELGELND